MQSTAQIQLCFDISSGISIRSYTANAFIWIVSPSFILEMLITNSEGIQSPYYELLNFFGPH